MSKALIPHRPAPPQDQSLDSIARRRTAKAMDVIDEIMTDPFAENRDRLAAAREVLDRGHGKPNQAIIQVPASRRLAAILATKSDAELMAAIDAYQLPTLDAQFTEVVPRHNADTSTDDNSLDPLAQ